MEPLRRACIVATLVMVGLLSIVQFVPALDAPPLALYLIFSAVWVFGAAMLWRFPRFGAIGTTLYGIILGVQVFAMHGVTSVNIILAIGSFAAAGLAASTLLVRGSRTGGAPA